MKEYCLNESIQVSEKLIRSLFIERNVSKALNFLDKEEFTLISSNEEDILTSIEVVEEHLYKCIEPIQRSYKYVQGDYKILSSSGDSCIVYVKVKFQGLGERKNCQTSLKMSLYFKMKNENVNLVHCHMHTPIEKEFLIDSQHFISNKNFGELLQIDITHQQRMLKKILWDTEHMAVKIFCYEKDFPYCYVNDQFLKLEGSEKLSEFIKENKFSSLAHINLNDQQRYIDTLKDNFPEELSFSEQGNYKWQGSYEVEYKLQTFDNRYKDVHEFGNLFTFNNHSIVSSTIFELKKKEVNTPPPPVMMMI